MATTSSTVVSSTQLVTETASISQPQETTTNSEEIAVTKPNKVELAEQKNSLQVIFILAGACAGIFLILSGMVVLIIRNQKRNQSTVEINEIPEDKGHNAVELDAFCEENEMYGVVGIEENDMYGEVGLEKFGLEEENDMYGIVK